MIIPFPIGLWVFALASDIAFMATGNSMWHDFAFYTILGGIIGALVAALPGFVDFASLDSPQTKKVALWHMILNLLAVVVFAIDLWQHSGPPTGSNSPLILSIIGIIIIIISGWLGGELVYVRGVAVEPAK